MPKRLRIATLAGLAVVATGGVAVAATLPDQATAGRDRAEEKTGFEIPASEESHPTQDDHPGGPPAEVPPVEVEAPPLPDAATFGDTVSDAAQSGAPQEDGRAFGEQVSTQARAEHQPAVPDHPSADDNPGTGHADAGAGNAPVDTPTADDNPGTGHADAGAGNAPVDTPAPGGRP